MNSLLTRIWLKRQSALYLVFIFACAFGVRPVKATDPVPFTKIQAYLQKYCSDCHGSSKPEGNLSVESDLVESWTRIEHREKWQEVYRVLVNQQMPPDDSSQPSVQESSEVIDWIIAKAASSGLREKSRATPVRRLTKDQYQRTLRSLLNVELDVSEFPMDPPAGGFTNNAAALSLSPLHMELYIEAAARAIDLALVEGKQPEPIRWRFEIDEGNDDGHRVRVDKHNPIVNGGNNPVQDGWKVIHHESWDKNLNVRDFRVPTPGRYRIRFRAAGTVPSRAEVLESTKKILAVRREERVRENPNGAKYIDEEHQSILDHIASHPAYSYGPPRAKLILDRDGQPSTLAEIDIDSGLDNPKVYEFSAWIEDQSLGMTVAYAYNIPKHLENFWFQGNDAFARPTLLVDWMEIEGPVYDAWPPSSHRTIVTSEHEKIRDVTKRAKAVVGDFMQRAYRRTVSEDEVLEKAKLFDLSLAEESGFLTAIRKPLIAILSSPHFLYLPEPISKQAPSKPQADAPSSYVDDEQYASRLSYFLWGTMPDQELLDLAREKKLRNRTTISKQIDRMLADPRSDALVDLFASQWLGLQDVGANPPATDLYPDYDRHLESSMVGESKAFFAEILHQDHSLLNLIASDFLVINERMARHYSIDGVRGDHFRKVVKPEGIQRGGVVTQASILTTTSNGTRTSPVKRGTWILKNLLGTDPGLPVDNVGDIAPKVPGIDKATVRKRLEIHRQLPQCARCHNKIDPLGFALENFNAAGQWRDREGFGYNGRIGQDDPIIDARSQMPDGTALDGVGSLQKAMLERQDLFVRCFAEKLFTYAIGRELTMEDRPYVDAAIQNLSQDDFKMRTLLKSIALSPLFTKYSSEVAEPSLKTKTPPKSTK